MVNFICARHYNIKKSGINKIFIAFAAALIYCLFISQPAYAMYFESDKTVFKCEWWSQHHKLHGDKLEYVTSADGDKLKFQRFGGKSMSSSYVKFMSADGKNDYFSFPMANHFKVKQINAEDPSKTFWVITTSMTDNDNCNGLWVIGKYKGKYVVFLTLETLQKQGIKGKQIKAEVEDGKLYIEGFNTNSFEYIHSEYAPDDLPYEYVTDKYQLFWDNKAQWFGFKSLPIKYPWNGYFNEDPNYPLIYTHQSYNCYADLATLKVDEYNPPVYQISCDTAIAHFDGTNFTPLFDESRVTYRYNLDTGAMYAMCSNGNFYRVPEKKGACYAYIRTRDAGEILFQAAFGINFDDPQYRKN